MINRAGGRGAAAHAAERAARGRALRVRRGRRRHAACRAEPGHPLHDHREAARSCRRGSDQLDAALLPRAQPLRPDQRRRRRRRRARVSRRTTQASQALARDRDSRSASRILPVRPEGGDRVAGLTRSGLPRRSSTSISRRQRLERLSSWRAPARTSSGRAGDFENFMAPRPELSEQDGGGARPR